MGQSVMPSNCPDCGCHECRCEPDWRALEAARASPHVVSWVCTHLAGDAMHRLSLPNRYAHVPTPTQRLFVRHAYRPTEQAS